MLLSATKAPPLRSQRGRISIANRVPVISGNCDLGEEGREADAVDADLPLAPRVAAVQPVHGLEHLVDRVAGELVAQDVEADLLVGRPERLDGDLDALDRGRVAEGVPARQPLADGLAAGGRVGDPLARVAREHVDPLVVHDLQALHPRVGVEHLVHLLPQRGPGESLHAARGVDDEDDVLAVHGDAADRRVGGPLVGPRRSLLLQPLHLLGELLLRGQEAPGDDVLDRGELLARRVAALDPREVAREPRHLEPLLRDLLLSPPQLAVEDGRLPANRRELLLEPREEPREVLLRPLERRRLPHLVEDEEQDDRPEAAAHHVEERQAEDLERPPLPPPHGQALEGVMREPRLAMASFQKAGVAIGSPSMG